jgi:hypothetical protein
MTETDTNVTKPVAAEKKKWVAPVAVMEKVRDVTELTLGNGADIGSCHS